MSLANELVPFFEERYDEVGEYLNFLDQLERATQAGVPRLVESDYTITASQQKILYSSLYLQLYNLVEATVARCIDAVTTAAQVSGDWLPHQLSDQLQREWVRNIARTHTDMDPENRLKCAMELSNHIVNQLPVSNFTIDRGGGGNWDDEAIYNMGKRLGCMITVSPETNRLIKAPLRDEMGSMKLVRNRRNELAHGSISFVECADGVTVEELRKTAEGAKEYLLEVIHCFVHYINSHDFLKSDFRPNSGAS